ncbi:hypothetical protein OCH239_17445 [Roseivivax halodurans JCM 10272]|uniref:HTH gntR-type domain-containing protein n=1 Tax=Roseivivax halodurans JCM 10272 TaxID=1449350 RepID=X7EBZ0_9RHOB|nr:GntR family transcriptional regulator [Roseivivax halodurans]ETX12731.1 hypothetical protein OCH239_17445 [Roseivivax halodurans JCM 10272]
MPDDLKEGEDQPRPALGHAEPVAVRIRSDIATGRIPAGARLKTQELAARYGTSINPVREALHQLSGEGFAQIEKNRGARVRELDETLVRNIYDIRALIEPYMIRLFVSHATETDIARLTDLQERIEAQTDPDQSELRALDAAFHEITYAGHFNSEALTIFNRQSQVVRTLGMRFPASPARRTTQNREHRALIDAISAGDEESAADIVRQHCRGAERHLREQLRRGQE